MKEKITGKVLQTFSAKVGQSGGVRPTVPQLQLIKDYGIKDDKFANKDLERTVMIVGSIAYQTAQDNAIELEFGSLGENLLLDFDPHILDIGDKLYIGDSIIQVTQKCTICNHLAIYDDKLPKLVAPFRGLYAKIIASGKIIKNMEVSGE